MANCFEDIIGIRGQCGTITSPSSGLWINDLPFINLKLADAIIGSDDDSGIQFLRDKINYAVNAVKAEINAVLSPYFKQNSVLEQALLGRYEPQMLALAQGAERRGIMIKIDDYPFLEFVLTGIALYSSNFTGNTTIKVHDLITGQEIDSFSIAVTAGQVNYVAINKRYLTNGQRFYALISYDATAINSYQTGLTISGAGDCLTCNRDGYKSGRYMTYNGASIATGSTVLYQSLSYPGHSSGLSIQYNVGCATDAFLCSIKNQMAWPILHKAGAEICREVVNGSTRVNSYTTIDKDSAAALLIDYEAEYMRSSKNVLNNLKLPNDVCFSCFQGIKTRVRVP